MKKLITLSATILLTACMHEAEDPKLVAQQYWQALVDKDYETAQQLVSNDSQDDFDSHVEAVNNPGALSQVALDDHRTVVITTLNPSNDKPYNDRPFESVMVLEDGHWKIDLEQTRLPPPPTDLEKQLNEMANGLSDSVDESLDTMEDVIDESMRLLDETLNQGSREMSDSFESAMRKMQEAMRESIESMKRRRDQMEQAPEPAPAPNAEGEGVI